MSGGTFINGPVVEPKVEVEQIFRLRNPLVPDSTLTTVVIGVNRQVVDRESIGNYDGALVDLNIASLAQFSATLVELAPITYVNVDGEPNQTPSLPHVVLSDPRFGEATIPKKNISTGVLGWTFDQNTGDLTLDAGMSFVFTIAEGTANLTEQLTLVAPNNGLRELVDSTADFIAAQVSAGDIVQFSAGQFEVVEIQNEITLLVRDLPGSTLPPTGELVDAAYSITHAGGQGEVLVSYAANRTDRSTELVTVDLETLAAEFGEPNWLNPLAFFARQALINTNTSIIALQLSEDTASGWQDAIETLEQSEVPYNLVPLTQNRARLAELTNHVELMSSPGEAKERRAFINYPLVIQETIVPSGPNFNPIGRPALNEVDVTVLAGNNNLHVLGVEPGMVFRDITPGFEGDARIISITPASAAPDANVTLTVAVPNTLRLVGEPAQATLTPVSAQEFVAFADASGTGAGDVIHITVDGTTTIFTAAAAPATPDEFVDGDNDSLLAVLSAYYGTRLNITQPGGAGTDVRIADAYGGASTVGLRSSATVTWELQGGGPLVVNLPAGPDTALPANDVTAGHAATNTFILHDPQLTFADETFVFVADQTTPNGSLLGGNTVVQIGGPLMTPAAIRARILDAITNGAGTGASNAITASLGPSPILILVSNVAGLGDGNGLITSAPAPLMSSDNPGSGANNGSPITTWEVATKAATVDEQATQIAQFARDTSNRRIINVWPDLADYVFTDNTAGPQALPGQGLFGGGDVNVPFQPNYGSTVALSALRSSLLASTPLTKTPVIGPFRLRRLRDVYTKSQLERILSTGNTVMEQLGGAGSLVQAVRAVSTDSSDLKVVEENVAAQVDKFVRLLRIAVRPIFGPNIIDPDGNFFEMFSTKVQAVIDRMTNRRNREARRITILRVYENPERKDSVIMEIEFEPLFGANLGVIQIFV